MNTTTLPFANYSFPARDEITTIGSEQFNVHYSAGLFACNEVTQLDHGNNYINISNYEPDTYQTQQDNIVAVWHVKLK